MTDNRWEQSFNNFTRALEVLRRSVALSNTRALSELERLGVVRGFTFTHELAWNVIKNYLEAQGFANIIGSKNATREAFKNGLITDGDAWMDMIKARNLTSHTYNLDVANGIVTDILTRFFAALEAMEKSFAALHKHLNRR